MDESVGKQTHHGVVARIDAGPRAREAHQGMPAVSGRRLSVRWYWIGKVSGETP